MTITKLTENYEPDANSIGKLVEADGGRVRREITVIQSGWGSSGYYSEAMLKRDGGKVFPSGLHMYMDHPTESDGYERPERSVKDLAAVFLAPAQWSEAKGGLVTEAEIFPTYQEALTHDGYTRAIGTSIIAWGESEHGSAEGREGPVITKLTQGASCDFVTHAGAGGEVGRLIEAAAKEASWPITVEEARNAADWLAAYIHSRFTICADDLFGEGHLTVDERKELSAAIGQALDAFNAYIGENVPQLRTRDPYGEPDVVTSIESGKPPEEDGMDEKDEARLAEIERKLEAAEQRATEAEKTAKEEKERADRVEDKALLAEAKVVVKAAVAKVEGLPERAQERVVDKVLEKDLPLSSTGALIESELKESATKVAEDEKSYLVGGDTQTGRVRGMGDGGGDGSTFAESRLSDDTDEKIVAAQERLQKTFQRRGMSESAAETAARGR